MTLVCVGHDFKKKKKISEAAELLRETKDVRDEIKHLRGENPQKTTVKQEIFVDLSESSDENKRLDLLESEVAKIASELGEVKDSIFKNATSSNPFINQGQINATMLEHG